MSTKCPYCGSSNTEKTFNFNESTCNICNCDFKVTDGRIRIFNEGSWKSYCENMAKHVSNAFNKPDIVELGSRLFKEHSKSPEEIDILLDHVIAMAENLNFETKAGVRDKHDFIEMVKIAESVDATYKTLYSRKNDLDLDLRERQFDSGIETVNLPGEEYDIEDFEEPEDEVSDDEVPREMGFGGKVSNEASSYFDFESGEDVAVLDPEDEEEDDTFISSDDDDFGKKLFSSENSEELEEDHLDPDFDLVKNDLRDLSNKTFNVDSEKDVWEIRNKIDDVERAVDDLYSQYKAGYEDGEDGEEGDIEDDLDLDMDLGDDGSGEDLDLDIEGDEGGEDLDMDIDLGDEEEEEEGLVSGLDVASHQRKGGKLSESNKPEKMISKLKKGNKNFNKAEENPGHYVTNKGIGVQKSQEDFEENTEKGQVKDDIPFVQGDEVVEENQFGDDKLSTAKGAVKGTPTIDDFTLKGKPSGTGLGIREGFNGFRLNDKVFISESRDEWEIIAINKSIATVQRKNTKTEVDLLSENVEHCDRNLRSHRDRDLMNETKNRWEQVEKQINEAGCIGGVCGLGEDGSTNRLGSTMVSDMSVASIGDIGNLPSTTKAVVDKSEIYKYIKDNDLHRRPREIATEDLIYNFNNPLEEINQILDDAVLSNDELQTESIDSLYHYETNCSRRFEEDRKLEDAYKIIEARDSKQRGKLLRESKSRKQKVIITRREEQNNDPDIENLGRTWINKISEGLEEV